LIPCSVISYVDISEFANIIGIEIARTDQKLFTVIMNKPKLFVKQGCPWCIDALQYFKTKSLELDVIDVRIDSSRMAELVKISGQSKTPTLQNGSFVVADFDIEEFETAMSQNPEEAKKLGFA